MLQRVGQRRWQSPQARRGQRHRLADLACRIRQPEPFEVKQPRLAERALIGVDRREIEPVALERGSAEDADRKVRAVDPIRFARRIVDPDRRFFARHRRDTNFTDLRSVRVQHLGHEPANADLLGIRNGSAAGGGKGQKQGREAEPRHGSDDTRTAAPLQRRPLPDTTTT